MQAKITNMLLSNLPQSSTTYEVNDTELRGFLLRVMPTGTKTYICSYRLKGSNKKNKYVLGRASVLTPAQARDEAKKILGDVARGIDPNEAHKAARAAVEKPTLGQFLDGQYTTFASQQFANSRRVIAQIKAGFKEFLNKPLDSITGWQLEKWKSERRASGLKASSINRVLGALRSCLSRAVEWELLDSHPLVKVKQAKAEEDNRVRYLSPQEEGSLQAALDQREATFRQKRASHNAWLKQRGLPEKAIWASGGYVDHIYPMVILAMHTGLRRGELFQLKRGDVNFDMAQLKVRAAAAKSRKSRFVPLNKTALTALQTWVAQRAGDDSDLVFPGKFGASMDNITSAWERVRRDANLQDFHWHDLRHHFASMLVMKGVDLNTVRELMGHADLKMTLRYSHLAPEHKAQAVAKLDAA